MKEGQKKKFPLSDNMLAQLFIVSSSLDDQQLERLYQSLSVKEVTIDQYTTAGMEQTFRELFASAKTSFADPFMMRSHKHKQRRSYIITRLWRL